MFLSRRGGYHFSDVITAIALSLEAIIYMDALYRYMPLSNRILSIDMQSIYSHDIHITSYYQGCFTIDNT